MNQKNLIIFDLDGTLAKSKVPIDREMAKLLFQLIRIKKVVIISGAKFGRFRKQVLERLEIKKGDKKNLKNLFISPTDGAMLFRRQKEGWQKVYERDLAAAEIKKIERDFKIALKKTKFIYPKHDHGHLVENRKTAVTFSALGQEAPLKEKEWWNAHADTRKKIIKVMENFLPGFEIEKAGLTSIDVMRKGINKGYVILKIMKILRMPKKKTVFVGDALFPGGNDYSAKKTGVDCIRVSGPDDTGRIIKALLEN